MFFNRKDIISNALVVFGFFIIAMAYCYPLLEGKRIAQQDNIQGRGMSNELRDYHKDTGGTALWTNSMFGGMPGYQIWIAYPADPHTLLHRFAKRWIPDPANKIFLLLLMSFFFLRVLEVPILLSTIGAIALTFPSYNFIFLEAGHSTKVLAIAYMFGVLGGVLLCYRKNMWLGGLVSALLFSFELKSNHYQITYYLMMALLVLFIIYLVEAIRNKTLPRFLKRSGVLGLAMLVGIGINTPHLWTTVEYTSATIRGGKSELVSNKEENTGGLDKEYALRWSFGIGETMTLLIPNFYGGSSSDFFYLDNDSKSLKALQRHPNRDEANQLVRYTSHYWGDMPFTSGPAYIGAVMIFLFVLGLYLVQKGSLRSWILIVTCLSILLSWGRNLEWFTDLFFGYFPMYNKFRAVSTMIILAQITIPLMGILAIKDLVYKEISKTKLLKAIKISGGITGGICLLFVLMPGLLSFVNDLNSGQPAWFSSALIEDRKDLLVSDALRSLAFIALSVGLTWAFVAEKVNRLNFLLALGFLILVDAWNVNTRYLNEENYKTFSEMKNQVRPTSADNSILTDPDPHYRVYNTTTDRFNDALTSYFHKSVGGYHAAKLRRYQEIIENHLIKGNLKVFNMLNAKYFIVVGPDKKLPEAQTNPGALGNAWFVSQYQLVNNADEEINALSDFEPAQTAIVDQRFEAELEGLNISGQASANIELTYYSPDRLSYHSKAPGEQLAVFSEIYYTPGWEAFIDGQPQPHFRANYILRAMRVPAGEHQIEFRFEPRSYYMGLKISWVFQAILFLSFLAYIYLNYFRKTPELSVETEPEEVSENDSEDSA